MCSIHLFLPQKADLVLLKLYMKRLQYYLEGKNGKKVPALIYQIYLIRYLIINNKTILEKIWTL